jgi:hypothetical protein
VHWINTLYALISNLLYIVLRCYLPSMDNYHLSLLNIEPDLVLT